MNPDPNRDPRGLEGAPPPSPMYTAPPMYSTATDAPAMYTQPSYPPPSYPPPSYGQPAAEPYAAPVSAPPGSVAPGYPAPTAVPWPAPVDAPSRLVVFGQLYWRTVVLSVGGGAVIAFGIGVWAALASASSSAVGSTLAFIPVAVLVGAVFGAFLGFGAGFVTGGIGAGLLVPYRGVKQTRGIMVATALAIIVPCAIWFVAGSVHDTTTLLLDAAVVIPSLLGAGFGALWLVNWYVKRMAALGFGGDRRVERLGAPA